MARTLGKRSARAAPVVPPDAAFLATDLALWAGERVARSGRKLALMSRVETLALDASGTILRARVRGSSPSAYRLEVVAHDGFLATRCSCPYDWSPVCKHAVAAVETLRFPRAPHRRAGLRGRSLPAARRISEGAWVLAREDRVSAAREQEIDDRVSRARRERAKVRLLSGNTLPARFEVDDRSAQTPCDVTLRGARNEHGSCMCADYARNELATCKHVERARAWFRRRKKPAPLALLTMSWRPREWPSRPPDALQELRVDLPEGSAPDGLAAWFDAAGWLREPAHAGDAIAWAREAAAAARDAAHARGVRFDLDPLVATRVDEAAAGVATERADGERRVDEGSAWSEVVAMLRIQLHPYQEEGVRFLASRHRALLADDMGLGKTVQAVVAALLLHRTAGVERVLVVCPASIKDQWRYEIAKVCGERAIVVDNGRAQRLAAYREWRSGFLILNYELVLRDLDSIRAVRPDLVVLDEAQRIKNWDTKTATAVKRLESPYAFVLTGTPLENRLTELHSIVEFLHPRALGPRWRLLPFHARTDPGGRVLAYEDLDVLRARLRPLFLRRERATVLDQLPERSDTTFWTGMTLAQRRPYRRHAARIAALLARSGPLRPAEIRTVLASLTRMRILCNAFEQYAWERFEPRIARMGPEGELALHSPKLEEFARVAEDLLEQPEIKMVVFSQWERMLRLAHYAIRGLLARRGERAEVFHGGLDARSRTRMLDAFHTDPDLRILLSTDAGGLGLNLQDAASVVVHLEVPWNPAVLEQRVARVHRFGQRRGVQVIHFVTAGAIEERVRHVVEAKRALFKGLLVDQVDRVLLDTEHCATFVDQLRELLSA